MTKVLLIEDDDEIAKLIELYCHQENFDCKRANNGISALQLFEKHSPEVIILDLMLPGLDGLEVCQRIRGLPGGKDPYILMLTARGEEIDRIVGLSTGADDYVVKPFSPKELMARIRALTRRSQRGTSEAIAANILRSPHFCLDCDKRLAEREGQNLELTTLEFDLLSSFLAQPQRVWTRTQLINRLWGDDFFGDERVVDTHIARLRKKIESDPAKPQYLKTVIGVGYKFEDDV
jgi:DNA-binding response OmpR family regulator